MSVFLLGGGWSRGPEPEVWGGFVTEVRARAGSRAPRVRLVVIGVDEESRAYHGRYLEVLERLGLPDVLVERVPPGGTCPASALEDLDGLVVGGGPTPAYLPAMGPLAEQVRALVAGGTAYAGFSAGAAIAGTHAVVGGWRLDGVPVCPQDSDEGLDEVTVLPGLGLVDGAIDVHAAAWGNLSRLVAVVGARLAPHGVAIDEDTALRLDAADSHPSAAAAYARPGADRVTGAGRIWRVEPVDPQDAEDAEDALGEARGRSGPGRTLVERL
ncbi:hypothetical protein GCM10027596_03080 [Nocardioides korecus]